MRTLPLLLSLAAAAAASAQAPVPPANAQIPGTNLFRCGTPTTANPMAAADHPDCDFFQTNPTSAYAPTSTIRIPVVVHVIQNTMGTGNLSNAIVQSQIQVMNEDYRAMAGTNGGAGVDTQIEFFLATTDPNGNPTTGIVHYTNNTWFQDQGSYWTTLAWNTQHYLNIYTNDAGGGGVLGYVPDLPQGGSVLNTSADRVVILYSAFGRPGSIGAPYNLGRSCTHEVGHYLGLFHTFEGGCGSGSCYTSGDRICDTNAEANPRFGCPGAATSCGSPDPYHNYMDYSDDICMTGFTQEQARRMRCTLQYYRPLLGQPAGPVASATIRTGPGNLNSAYNCTPPRLGQTCTASVVLFTTPYSLAGVFGFVGAASVPFEGYTILIDTASPFVFDLSFQGGITAVWNFIVPNDTSIAGLPVKTQALLLGSTFALSNAVDLVVGS